MVEFAVPRSTKGLHPILLWLGAAVASRVHATGIYSILFVGVNTDLDQVLVGQGGNEGGVLLLHDIRQRCLGQGLFGSIYVVSGWIVSYGMWIDGWGVEGLVVVFGRIRWFGNRKERKI